MTRSLRTIAITTAVSAALVGGGVALAGPASAHDRGPGEIPGATGWPSSSGNWWSDSGDDWEDDWEDGWGWGVDWRAQSAAYSELQAALADAQAAYDEAATAARTAYAASIRDEQAAYREARATAKSQVGRLLAWRGYTASIRDEQRVLNKALDRATTTQWLDEDAAKEVYDLEIVDETVAAGRSSYRSATRAADVARTRAQRAVSAAYEEAVDVAVQRLASVLTEARTVKARAAAWAGYRKGLAGARTAQSSALGEAEMAYQSTVDEATGLLAPGDESYAFEGRPVPCYDDEDED